MHMSFVYLIVSACTYGAAFLYPTFFWWGTVVSMLLLMCIRTPASTFFWYGFAWATIAYSMHLAAVIVGIVRLAATPAIYASLPGFLLILYLALFTAFFWWYGALIEQYICAQYRQPCEAIRACWLSTYWLCMTYLMLWPLGRCEGYLLLNPIIPLATHPSALTGLPMLGVTGYTLLFCAYAGFCAYCMQTHKLLLLIGSALIIMACILMHNAPESDCMYPHIAHVPKSIPCTDEYSAACNLLHDYVAIAAGNATNVCGAVLPESAVYPWELCAQSLLATYKSGHDIHDYIIGSFYNDAGHYRNSCYWLHDGTLQVRFDKRHAMPLIERLPWFFKNSFFYNLFFATMPEIVPSDNERPLMMLSKYAFVPYICSELFFNRLPDDAHDGVAIVALVNDRWCPYAYMQELMYLGAVVQAYAWQRDILYVAYSRWEYIRALRCALF